MTATAIPGRAGARLTELGDRAVISDLYDEVGSLVYHQLASGDRMEIRELLGLVRPLPGPVLELAAGSGRLTLPLLALGRDVVALERSPSMLRLLHEQLATAAPAVRARCVVVPGDMSRFALDRRFGAIVLGTSSVSLLDAAGRKGLYRCVREHLQADGRFLLSTVDIDPSAALSKAEARQEEEAEAAAELELESDAGDGFAIYEHWSVGGEERTVTVFPAVVGEGPVSVCTTTIKVLPASRLRDELAAAGLRVGRTVPVSSSLGHRYTDVLLEVMR